MTRPSLTEPHHVGLSSSSFYLYLFIPIIIPNNYAQFNCHTQFSLHSIHTPTKCTATIPMSFTIALIPFPPIPIARPPLPYSVPQ